MNIVLYGILVMSLSLLTYILPAVFGTPVMLALSISISSIFLALALFTYMEKTNVK